MQENISFIKLLKGKGYSIQIPVIQRDYAQGRKDSKTQEIRVNFLDELESALEPDGRPLVLDFVYGSLDNYIFIPLDGQQRLTTLFLLHWYLCPDDAQFKEFLQKGDNSKFTYETRTSSKEFCNGLVKNHLSSIKREGFNTLSEAIKDASWFMWVWHKDPTIIGMLVMLDAIDAKLNGKNHENLWTNLTEKEQIVFHLLPLKQFNLTDELYVKMNARGKELSDFDKLKSTIEEQMLKNNVDENIRHRWQQQADSIWMNLFWQVVAKPKLANSDNSLEEEIEKIYLSFLNRMMHFHLFIDDECIPDSLLEKLDKEKYPEGLKSLRKEIGANDIDSILLLCKSKFFSESFFKFVLDTMNNMLLDPDSKGEDMSCLIILNSAINSENNSIFA